MRGLKKGDIMKFQKEEKKRKPEISAEMMSLAKKEILSRRNWLASASKQGLTVHSRKKFFLIPEKDTVKFLEHPVELFLSQYELSFYGIIKAIHKLNEDLFEVCVGFEESAPLYYRECVADLLS